jgi:hypothetical protein
MLKIHETTQADGTLSPTYLAVEEGGLVLLVDGDEDGESLALPERALEAVMRRYAAPLDPNERVTVVATLELGGGRELRHVRHLARWDVIARDWLVVVTPNEEPLCAMATTVAGALAHLARAAV